VAHQHYKGTGQMHSFRGILADDTQDKIRIEGATGEIAWRITKFQIIGNNPGAGSQDSVMKIYRESQSSVDGLVDFSDAELLGVAYWTTHEAASAYTGEPPIVIFDNDLFSRNIYVTHEDVGSNAQRCNYYIELEEVKVSAAGMAQLAVAAARRLGLNP